MRQDSLEQVRRLAERRDLLGVLGRLQADRDRLLEPARPEQVVGDVDRAA